MLLDIICTFKIKINSKLYSDEDLFTIRLSLWLKKKTCSEQLYLVSVPFIKVFCKKTNCSRQPISSGPKSGHPGPNLEN